MSNFIIYDASGAILRTGYCPDSMMAIQAQAGESVMAGSADQLTQFVSAGAVVNKPALGSAIDKTTCLANSTDTVNITALPNPTSATITGPGVSQQATVTTGSLALTFNLAGTWTVKLEALNTLPQEYTINAT